MRGRVWLSLSLALNLFLALLLWRQSAVVPGDVALIPLPDSAIQTIVHTNTVVRRKNFVWADIESADYAVFIANLRHIGCPEPTIRDIIVADVNQLFLRRHATEIVTPQQQWWRSDPDPELVQSATAAALALARERRELLTQLLGPDWESAEYPFPSAFALSPLDGPVLGQLAPATKAAVHEVERSTQERLRAYLDEMTLAGEIPDPATLAGIREESRSALSRILDPQALEEYLLRYSSLASELRTSLRGLDITAEQFRALFRALDPLRDDLQLATPSESPAGPQPVTPVYQLRQDALRQILGQEQYEELQLSHDPLYQEASQIISRAGVTEDQLVPVAAIVRLAQEEITRIRDDPSLTSVERIDALHATRQAQFTSLRVLLGEAGFQRYLDSHPEFWP